MWPCYSSFVFGFGMTVGPGFGFFTFGLALGLALLWPFFGFFWRRFGFAGLPSLALAPLFPLFGVYGLLAPPMEFFFDKNLASTK